MRVWIDYLYRSTAAYADFMAHLTEAISERQKRQQNALLENRLEDAKGLAHEIKVFTDMQQRFSNSVNEYQKQQNFERQVKKGE